MLLLLFLLAFNDVICNDMSALNHPLDPTLAPDHQVDPVAHVTATISFDKENKQIDLEDLQCTDSTRRRVPCVGVKLTIMYEGVNVPNEIKLEIEYALDTKKIGNIASKRLFFSNNRHESNMHETITLLKGQMWQSNLLLYLPGSNIEDKLTSLDVSFRLSLGRGQQGVVLAPGDHVVTDSLEILKECGQDNVCIPSLSAKTQPIDDYLLGSGAQLELEIEIQNAGEDAFNCLLQVQVPRSINFLRANTGDPRMPLICTSPYMVYNGTLLCLLGNPLRANAQITAHIFLQPTLNNLEGSLSEYEFSVSVNSSNPEAEGDDEDNLERIIFPIKVKTDIAKKFWLLKNGTWIHSASSSRSSGSGSVRDSSSSMSTSGNGNGNGRWEWISGNGRWEWIDSSSSMSTSGTWDWDLLPNGSYVRVYKPPSTTIKPVDLTAHVIATVRFDKQNKLIDLEDQQCIDGQKRVPCVGITVTLMYEGDDAPNKVNLLLEYILDAKKTWHKRLFFPLTRHKGYRLETITLSKGQTWQRNFMIYLTGSNIEDKLTSLDVSFRFSLGRGQQGVVLAPGDHVVTDSLEILKMCGQDNVCIPSLSVNTTVIHGYLLESGGNLELVTTIQNKGEDAFNTILQIQVPQRLNYISANSSNLSLACSPPTQANNRSIQCPLGNPLKAMTQVTTHTFLQPFLESSEEPPYGYEITVSVKSSNPEAVGSDDNMEHFTVPIPPIKVDEGVLSSNQNDDPMANIIANISFDKIDLDDQQCILQNRRVPCVGVTLTLVYSGVNVPWSLDLELEYILDAKKDKQSQKRLFFLSDPNRSYKKETTTFVSNIIWKDHFKVYAHGSNIQDMLTSLDVQVKYTLARNQQNVVLAAGDDMVTDNLEIIEMCGQDNVCIPAFIINTSKHHCKKYEKNSHHCNGKGTYKCGICECPADSFGPNCECDADNLRLGADLEDGCRPDNTSQTLCNNRGDCICGKCECYPSDVEGGEISGDFCECDNFSCDRNNQGLLCSGPDHGECVCGKCSCNSEWDVEGYSACQCRNSRETCITPRGEHVNKVCSGRGTCTCGECTCERSQEGEYGGKYCEECPNCPDKCAELKPCVQCMQFNTGEYVDGENDLDEDGISMCDKCPFEPLAVDHVESDNIRNDERLCANNVDEDGCRFTFAYGYSWQGWIDVWVQRNRDCP